MTDLTARITAGMAALTDARAATFLDTCTITRPADPGQTPPLDDDGNITTPADPVVYTGPCLLGPYKAAGIRATVKPTSNEDDSVPEPLTLKLPTTADARMGDEVTMDTCAFAPALAGEVFRVLHENPRSYATFRSITVRGFSWPG